MSLEQWLNEPEEEELDKSVIICWERQCKQKATKHIEDGIYIQSCEIHYQFWKNIFPGNWKDGINPAMQTLPEVIAPNPYKLPK